MHLPQRIRSKSDVNKRRIRITFRPMSCSNIVRLSRYAELTPVCVLETLSSCHLIECGDSDPNLKV